MMTIENVKSGDIFIKESALTNLIKGKKLRRTLLENGVKVTINRERVPMFQALGNTFSKEEIVFDIHHPKSINKEVLNEIVHQLSMVIYRKYDNGQIYKYTELDTK